MRRSNTHKQLRFPVPLAFGQSRGRLYFRPNSCTPPPSSNGSHPSPKLRPEPPSGGVKTETKQINGRGGRRRFSSVNRINSQLCALQCEKRPSNGAKRPPALPGVTWSAAFISATQVGGLGQIYARTGPWKAADKPLQNRTTALSSARVPRKPLRSSNAHFALRGKPAAL